MFGEEDPMAALVESWDTFLVEPTAAMKNGNKNSKVQHRREEAFTAKLIPLSPRTFVSDSFPPLSFLNGSKIQPLQSTDAFFSDAAPSLLWLLTLVSRNVELLRAAAHLFLQFNAQFATLLEANESAINDLRERHQQQLASLLEVADSHTTADMIVDSTVTKRVVHQQEQELAALERRCGAAERELELQLQETLFTFLNTSAPDAVAAANRKADSLCWVTDSRNASGNGVGDDGLYRAEVDVSRFAEIRKEVPRHSHQSSSAVAPFSPLRLVPVRTIKLNNEVGNAAASLINSPTHKRSNDMTLQPIILDVSPLSGLKRCLTCCSGTQPGAVSSSVSSAAEEHLLRLAHTRHSVLLLIGTEAAALEVVAACKAPELLLGASHTCREGFKPLPHHPLLHVLFTTRLWGANVVLLWNPSQQPHPSFAASSATAADTVVEDALELAYAWDADMFSVAVMEGAQLPQYSALESTNATAPRATSTLPSSPASAFFTGQAMSMEVLRQLRNGVTRELLETAGTRRSRCWQGSMAWLQLGGGSANTAGTHMCPRAVGVLYANQAAAAAAGGDAFSRSASSPITTTATAAAAAASPSSPSGLFPSQLSTSSPPNAFRGTHVTFNTPLAIRVFLPLPEEYFIKERPNHSGADANSYRVRHSTNSSSSNTRGELGSWGGAALYTEKSTRRGRVGRSGVVHAAATSDVEDNLSGEVDFGQGSFTSSSVPRSAQQVLGDGAQCGSCGASFAQERQCKTMSLEALIHYAFGEFAETL